MGRMKDKGRAGRGTDGNREKEVEANGERSGRRGREGGSARTGREGEGKASAGKKEATYDPGKQGQGRVAERIR